MAIELRPPASDEIPQLHCLFVEVFGEPDFAADFFRLGFSQERCLIAFDEEVLGMLHWFDCLREGKRLAYLYAIAVKPACQGRGIGSALIRFATEYLRSYDGIFLVPGEESLFSYYEKFGFSSCSTIREVRAAAGPPVPVQPLSPTQFAQARQGLLPQGGILQEGPMLKLLSSYAAFYSAPRALAVVSGGHILEFLGDETILPGMLCALGLDSAPVRLPGAGRPFAMGLGLGENLYFGLALD